MSLFSKSFKAFLMVVATALLPMLASCQLITEDYDDEISDNSASRYINITVSVSASNEPVTRANPTGGETGDGLEKGLERENAVDNITLIFYKDAGINNIDANTKVAFFATYPVTKTDNYYGNHNHQLEGDSPAGWTGESNDNEVIYSTGDQKLDEGAIDVKQTYHAIVVANAPNALLANITPGVTTISALRDMVVSTVYEGTEEETVAGVGTAAQKFVMSSERDATVTFTNKKIDEQKNTITYYFECIHIERLAARIDFCAKTKNPDATATYMAAAYDADNYDYAGYVYNVGQKDANNKQDHFVLTSITPFNLMTGDEYLLKRTNDTNGYLAKETTSNWVLDPYTALKNTAAHPDYLVSPLTSVKANMANKYNIVLSTRQTASTETTEGTKFSIKENGVTADNIIIGYPKENTLTADVTPLYYYATGLAFEGYYYSKNATKDANGKYTGGERKVFYHYLRHQGGDQDAAYSALTDETLDTDTKCPASPAMNFGIVRNNIYRVCIESITPVDDDIKVTLLIKVKKWDKFVHEPIYM